MHSNNSLCITLMRAGMTKSGAENRLLGWKEESLLKSEKKRLLEKKDLGVYPASKHIYTSPALRCRETAQLVYPGIPALVDKRFAPFDYGDAEGMKFARQKTDTVAYSNRIISDFNMFAQYGGESPYGFSARVGIGFQELIEDICRQNLYNVVIITHALVIERIIKRVVIPKSQIPEVEIVYGGGVLLNYDKRFNEAKIKRVIY